MSTFRARRGFCGIFTLSILAATTALTAVPAAAETIGITSAVNLNAVGTPPAQDTRVLQVGLDMFANEKVDTGQVGQTHLIFDDGSALTIGPNSSVVLDEFVYDPETKSGKLVVSVGKGLMRYVGGKISKKTPVVFKTPTSVIGIRGGIALIEANTPGAGAGPAQGQGGDAPLSSVTLIYGEDAFLQSGDRTERMTRPGSRIVQQLDRTVLPPVVVPPSVLQNALGRLEETGNADAGELVNALGASPQALAELAPAAGPDVGDEDIADSQLANLSSGNDPNVLVTLLPNLSPIDFEEPSEILVPDQAGSGSNIISEPPPVTFSGPTGAIKRAENPEFGAEFDSFFPFASISSLDGATFNGSLLFGGDLTLPIGSGTFEATSTSQPFGATPLEGIGVLSDTGDFLFYELEDPSDGSRLLAFAGNPTPLNAFPDAGVTAYELRDDFALGGVQIPFISTFQEFGLIDAGQTPTAYINWNSDVSSTSDPVLPAFYSSTIVISGTGSEQDSVASVIVGNLFDDGLSEVQPFLVGRFRGSASDTAETTGYTGFAITGLGELNSNFFGGSGAPGIDDTGPENFVLQSAANLVLPPDGDDIPYGANAVATAIDPGDAGSQQSGGTLNGWFSGFSREFDQSGEFDRYQQVVNGDAVFEFLAITTKPDQNRVEASFGTFGIGPGNGTITLNFGDSDGGFTQSAYIDDNRFAAVESFAGSDFGLDGTVSVVEGSEIAYLVTGDQVTFDNALPSGVSICDCEFTTWGFIGVGADFTDGSSTEIHLLPWVAGELASDLDLFPTAGSATYQGTVIGTTVLGALNDPQATAHKAFGNIELQFLFGVDSGSGKTVEVLSGTITGYDNGTIALVGNGPSSAPRFDFMIDAANSNIPGVFALDDEVSGGLGRFIGPNNPPENAIGTGFLVGSSTDNLSNQDYNSNFVLFTETDGSVQPVQ